MKTWICTALLDGVETSINLDAEDLVDASAAGVIWAEAQGAQFTGVCLVDDSRQAGIAKLVSLGLTPEEAMAVAGG